MFGQVFRPDGGLHRLLSRITDIMALCGLWIVCSLPLFTVGAASSALYDTVVHSFRRGETVVYGRFFTSFRRNLKGGLVLSAIVLVGTVLALYVQILLNAAALASRTGYVLYFTFQVVQIVLVGMGGFAFAILSRFECSLGRLLGNTLRLSLTNVHLTVLLGLLGMLSLWLCTTFWWPLILVPWAGAYAASFLLEPCFKPFENPETQE